MGVAWRAPEVLFSTLSMAEGYCVKCKAKKEIADALEEVMKNGRKAIKGKCPTCGVVMFKILGGKVVPPGPLTAPAANAADAVAGTTEPAPATSAAKVPTP
jgi:uncharacterized Zn finger protein (UPF0148 family)